LLREKVSRTGHWRLKFNKLKETEKDLKWEVKDLTSEIKDLKMEKKEGVKMVNFYKSLAKELEEDNRKLYNMSPVNKV